MRGFALDESGDIIIKNNKIQMVEGNDLLQQTVRSVLGTNKGEWFANVDEGITFSNILGKNKTEEMIKHEVQEGLKQVDDTFVITSFEHAQESGRMYSVKSTAQNSTGAELNINTTYG